MIYTVEKDKHDFKPNNQAWFTAKNKIDGSFRMDETMYFTREDPDYNYGSDAADWNKICGLTWFPSSSSHWSGMLAWRPNEKEKNAFEIAAYVNPKSGGFQAKKIMDVKAGELVFFQLIWVSDKIVFKVKKENEQDFQFYEMPLKNVYWWFPFYRQIGPWFGGNRPAHKTMNLELNFN